MNTKRRGVIFSDLDGTFLDAQYSPVLDAARYADVTLRWDVVWASSRTAEELLQIQRFLDSPADAIGENGGVYITRSADRAHAIGNAESIADVWVARLAWSSDAVASLVREAFTNAQASYRTVDQLTVHDLARRARYGVADATRAQRRRASVLLCDVDRGNPATTRALAALRARGCAVSQGGHWISVAHGSDKGAAALAWRTLYIREHGVIPSPVIAIGNSENDAPLLAVADRRFVVRNPLAGHAPELTALPRVERLQAVGTAGWLEMIRLLERDDADLQ